MSLNLNFYSDVFPREIFDEINKYFTVNDLLNLSHVCKTIQEDVYKFFLEKYFEEKETYNGCHKIIFLRKVFEDFRKFSKQGGCYTAVAHNQLVIHLIRYSSIFPRGLFWVKKLIITGLQGKAPREFSFPCRTVENVEFLKIRSLEITEFPTGQNNLKEFVAIESLYSKVVTSSIFLENLTLNSCKIGENGLKEISRMSKLKMLNLCHNHIKSLPKEFQKLSSLEKLVMSWNCFTKVPSVLESLKNLRLIDFGHNRIRELPLFIFKIPILRFHYNMIREIPKFEHFIEELDICGNVELREIRTMPNVRKLITIPRRETHFNCN